MAAFSLPFANIPWQSVAPLSLPFLYAVLSPLYPNARQRSWLLTAIAALVMVCVSSPLVAVFLKGVVTNGGTVMGIRAVREWAERDGGREEWWPVRMGARVFQTYLVSDLLIGTLHYPQHITLGSGWVHHIAYLGVVEYAIYRRWAHVFCFGAFMELPTAILAMSFLHPRLRNDVLFASTFFAVRIAFHLVLIYSYSPSWIFPIFNRAIGLSEPDTMDAGFQVGNYEYGIIPALVLATSWPVHLMWMVGCVKGIMRRRGAGVCSDVTVGPVGEGGMEGVIVLLDETEEGDMRKTKAALGSISKETYTEPSSNELKSSRGRRTMPFADITNPTSAKPNTHHPGTHSQSCSLPVQILDQNLATNANYGASSTSGGPYYPSSLSHVLASRLSFSKSPSLLSSSSLGPSFPGSYTSDTGSTSGCEHNYVPATSAGAGFEPREREGWRRRLRARLSSSAAASWIGSGVGTEVECVAG